MTKQQEQPKKNIYQKLHQIQVALMGLKKDKKGNNYEYVSGSKVLEHIKPLMNNLGLLLKQEILSIENSRQDYMVANKYAKGDEPKERTKTEILSKVMMKFTWVDIETGDRDENLFGANGQNDFDKGVGSAMTYAERYFFLKYFHIATDEDDIDNPLRKSDEAEQPTKAAEQPTAKPSKPTPPQQPTPEIKPNTSFTASKAAIKLSECAGEKPLTDELFNSMAKAISSNPARVVEALKKYKQDDVAKYVAKFHSLGFVIDNDVA